MKREIKFRAWHKAEEKMCNVELLRPGIGAFLHGVLASPDQITSDGKSIVIAPTHGRFCDIAEFELLEFTGLHDKQGREIYEGDIVLAGTKKFYSVTFENGSFKWGLLHLGYDEEAPTEQEDTATWAEVIGNIYENLNLLIT